MASLVWMIVSHMDTKRKTEEGETKENKVRKPMENKVNKT